jgi:hypothetical protein
MPLTPDAGRIPRWYSVTFGIMCGLYAAWGTGVFHGSTTGRSIAGVVLAFLAAGLFWTGRRTFRRTLARPVIQRNRLDRWLLTQPAWLMVLAYLTIAMALLALGSAVLYLAHDPQSNYLYGATATLFLIEWTCIPAMIQVRRLNLKATQSPPMQTQPL